MWKVYRLRKTREFTVVISQKKKVVNHCFFIFYSFNQLANCCFGISVPRKLVKRAVKRNYYKRQVKNMLIVYLKNTCQAIHPANPSTHYNFVIIVRSDYLKLDNSFQVKQKHLYKLFSFLARKELGEEKEIKKPKDFYV